MDFLRCWLTAIDLSRFARRRTPTAELRPRDARHGNAGPGDLQPGELLAERAMPRTWFTQAHTSQPPTDESTIAQKSPNHTTAASRPRSAVNMLGAVMRIIGAPPTSIVY